MDDRTSVDPRICGGKPCIRSTRIMVKNIVGMLAGGYSIPKVLESYPELASEEVAAALDYATHVIAGESRAACLSPWPFSSTENVARSGDRMAESPGGGRQTGARGAVFTCSTPDPGFRLRPE